MSDYAIMNDKIDQELDKGEVYSATQLCKALGILAVPYRLELQLFDMGWIRDRKMRFFYMEPETKDVAAVG